MSASSKAANGAFSRSQVTIQQRNPIILSTPLVPNTQDRKWQLGVVVLQDERKDVASVLAKTATFLGITGTLQAQQGVVHLVADRLWKP